MSSKKMPIAKKYFCFHGLDRKKVGLKRVRIAKKNHSSLLLPPPSILHEPFDAGSEIDIEIISDPQG